MSGAPLREPSVPGFTSLRPLGVGSLGEVWAAEEVAFHRRVALKVLDEHAGLDGTDLVRAYGRLSGVAGALELFRTVSSADGRTILVLPLAQSSLLVRVDQEPLIDAESWRAWLLQAAWCLDEAHRRGVSHGALHGRNALLTANGVVLCDFRRVAAAPAGEVIEAPASLVAADIAAFARLFVEVPVRGSDAARWQARLRTFSEGEPFQAHTAGQLATRVLGSEDRPRVVGPGPARRRGRLAALGAVAGLIVAGSLLGVLRWADGRSTEGGDPPTSVAEEPATSTTAPPFATARGDAVSISVGGSLGCSLLADGGGACWGANLQPQPATPADGLPGFSTSPFQLQQRPLIWLDAGSNGTGGDNVCAVADSGEVTCRGWSLVGLPEGGEERSDRLMPVGVGEALQVAVGHDHACALLRSGGVSCWGADDSRQLGGGGGGSPTVVPSLGGARSIAAGGSQTCVVKVDDTVWCWGLARPPLGVEPAPVQITGIPPAASVVAGAALACSLDADGAMWCWGDFEAVFGIRGASYSTPPTRLESPEPLVAVSVGDQAPCAVGASGATYCWSTGSLSAQRVDDVGAAVDVATDSSLSCVLHQDGGVTCWGPWFDSSGGQRPGPQAITDLGP